MNSEPGTKTNETSQTSDHSQRAEPLVALTEQLLPVWVRHIATVRRHSDVAVSNMLTAFADYQRLSAEGAAPGSDHASALQACGHQLLEAFQYQDRLSQRLALLENDINRLVAQLQDPHAVLPDAQQWLARLRGEYAMSDQHEDHVGGASSTSGGAQETHFF